MPSILIQGGRIIDPASGTDASLDLALADGRVARIAKELDPAHADVVLDARGCIVCPGLIDPHVHLREPGGEHKETIATGTHAAVFGGFTSVCCMPNTTPALDTPEQLRYVLERAGQIGHCRVFPVAAATRARQGEEPTELGLLARAGAVGFSDDGDCVASAGVMARLFSLIAPTGLPFMQHAQDPTLTRGSVMHAGSVAIRLGLAGWPRVAEECIVERDVRLLRASRASYHVQHVSSAGTVEIIRRARAEGLPVTGEASPHHLLLTHEACASYDTDAKMNPPLREQHDVDALRQGVAEGVLTILATDHAPHTADEKDQPFEEAPFGIIGLQTALPLYAQALVDTGLTGWPRLIALLTLEPARLGRLDARGLGSLAPGSPADVTLIHPDLPWTIDPAHFPGRSKNTPFAGRRVGARVVCTIVEGHIRFRDPWLQGRGHAPSPTSIPAGSGSVRN